MKKKLTSSNTKRERGVEKVSPNLLPVAGRIHGAIAMKPGADKYGFYNYREAKQVSLMMYLDAIERHLMGLLDGEDWDKEAAEENPDGPPVHHAGSIIACASIICDAMEHGNLKDDRPVKGPGADLIRRVTRRKKRG
jgi:hypothetical protein